jgi:hypothetical protein
LDEYLKSNGTITHDIYFRALAVGCVDAFVFLIAGILETVFLGLDIRAFYEDSSLKFPFYSGWEKDHTDWTPPHVPYSVVAAVGPNAAWILSFYYINEWTPVVVGFSVFALFGRTQEARQMYNRPYRFIARALRREPLAESPHRPMVSTVKFTPQFNPSCSTYEELGFVTQDKTHRSPLLTRNPSRVSLRSHSGGVIMQRPEDDPDKSRGSVKGEIETMYAHSPFSSQCTFWKILTRWTELALPMMHRYWY